MKNTRTGRVDDEKLYFMYFMYVHFCVVHATQIYDLFITPSVMLYRLQSKQSVSWLTREGANGEDSIYLQATGFLFFIHTSLWCNACNSHKRSVYICHVHLPTLGDDFERRLRLVELSTSLTDFQSGGKFVRQESFW